MYLDGIVIALDSRIKISDVKKLAFHFLSPNLEAEPM